MGTLTREAILSADDLKTEDVDVPEWGGSVTVRALTATGRDAMFRQIVGADGKMDQTRYHGALVASSVIDDGGDLLFSLTDAEALGNKSAAALHRVSSVAARLSGLANDSVDEAAKN